MRIGMTTVLSALLLATLLVFSVSVQAEAPTAKGPITLKQGTYKGAWVDRKYSGDLVLTVANGQAMIRFDNADKTCLGDKQFTATFGVDDLVEIPNPFVVDAGGDCGVFDVTMTPKNKEVEFYFHRRKWVKSPFSGAIMIAP